MKQTKSQKIVAYKKANPSASYSKIAEAVKCDISLIYPALKKAGLCRKNKVARKKVSASNGQIVLRQVLKETDSKEIQNLSNEVRRLEDQVLSYRAVINYLEFKLGIENGVAV